MCQHHDFVIEFVHESNIFPPHTHPYAVDSLRHHVFHYKLDKGKSGCWVLGVQTSVLFRNIRRLSGRYVQILIVGIGSEVLYLKILDCDIYSRE
jgi:hypothetical protein